MSDRDIVIRSSEGGVWFEGSWELHETPASTRKSTGATAGGWKSFDLVFKAKPTSRDTVRWPENFENGHEVLLRQSNGELKPAAGNTFGSTAAFEFLLQCLRSTHESPSARGGRVAKLLVPLNSSYIVRSDIVPLRFRDCEFVESAWAFSEPLQFYPARAMDAQSNSLSELLSASTAGLLLRCGSGGDTRELSSFTEAELENRLSLPWLIEQPAAPSRLTLALVEGSRVHPDYGGTGPGIYLAAKALGINMVVLDSVGHWLEGPEFAHWREAFIPTKLMDPPDAYFEDRIVESIHRYGKKVDGIITFCDSYMVQVAGAAQRLGLSTAPPEAYAIATDKYKTSVFDGHQAYRAASAEEALSIVAKENLTYPLIIKPCNGWSSEGVFRIDDFSALESAVKSIDTGRHGKDFVIERYCSGPEVDANFVLLDGEILFFEACDDFPKGADIGGGIPGAINTFIETNTVFPSALPSHELGLLRDSFHKTLLRLGLKDGLMHLEGRVDSSSVKYQERGGLVDLYPQDNGGKSTSAWLIEINPRPPGMTGTQIIESTHGVDYWGLAMLSALRDKPRVRALAQPFKHGPQYTGIMVFIPADYDKDSCRGIYDSDDMCAELLTRRPDLAKHISRYGCLVKKGQRVSHPSTGVNSFLAYFNVFSRRGRKEALEIAGVVREEVRFKFR